MYSDSLRGSEWNVRATSLAVARDLVTQHHYAKGGSNTATCLHGLFKNGSTECFGVAWWIPPTKSAAKATFPDNWRGVLCLSRFVITPGVPKNAATFLLSRSRKLIDREAWPCLVTYADTWRGHRGTIYLADNWTPCGLTRPERVYQIEGRMVARKAGPKTRTHAEMLALGAEMVGAFAKYKFVRMHGR